MMIDYHIDNLSEIKPEMGKYEKFHKKFFHMKWQLELRDLITYSTKEIDHYLWLAGQYIASKRGIGKSYYYAFQEILDDPDNRGFFEALFQKDKLEVIDKKFLSRHLI